MDTEKNILDRMPFILYNEEKKSIRDQQMIIVQFEEEDNVKSVPSDLLLMKN